MTIRIQGAREHNLQNITVEIGAGLTVVTGVSGSGKTSLVFDTLYHEAQRRFLEISALGSTKLQLSPAKVRAITGLGPAVAVGQNLLNRNPASNLATASGLHPFLRIFYARFGQRGCPTCGTGLTVLSEDEIVERLSNLARGGPLSIWVPLLHNVTGSHRTLLDLLASQFEASALRVDGRTGIPAELDSGQPHSLEVEAGRLNNPDPSEARQVVQQAAALGGNTLVASRIALPDRYDLAQPEQWTFSRAPVCSQCGTWFGQLEPVHFHTPCPDCQGAGCEHCQDTGLHPAAAAVRWQGLHLPGLLALPVETAQALFQDAGLPDSASRLRSEIERRLEALVAVGLGYVSLDRPSPSLSRGEAQRVRLAVALTSRLEDLLHVLDEPTIGQHPTDVARLLPAFRRLPGPVVYVEHDRGAAAVADQAIDLGPGAGSQGGRLLYSGTPAGLWQADTPTGRYFSLRERLPERPARPAPKRFLTVRRAHLRNLKDLDVPIPLGRLSVVTGVSGSGKSTLVEDVLVASLAGDQPQGCQGLEGPRLKAVLVDQSPIGLNPRSNPATYTHLADIIRDFFAAETGLSPSHFSFNRPEGACPTCNGMGAIEVQLRHLPSTWIPCADCNGRRFSEEVLAAQVHIGGRLHSIADVYESAISEIAPGLLEDGGSTPGAPPGSSLAGSRLPKGKRQTARQILEALHDVGLGYLTLGQPSPTLSGGEAQRVKLAKFLGRRSLGGQLLVLDEPTTGLHPQDVAGLLIVLERLTRQGATIVVVEHNLDMIRAADWVIDLGPGAGPHGGQLLYSGPPAGLSSAADSLTGAALQTEPNLRPKPLPGPPPAFPSAGTEGNGTSAAQGIQVEAGPRPAIVITSACAHNLKDVSVAFPKAALSVVTGVSGSGKSSLVGDVLEAEARRRFLESLSMYERQSTREGPEAPVEAVTGLGVAVTIGPERRMYERRATVGSATEIAHHLAVLLSFAGERNCPQCGTPMGRGREWICPACGRRAPIAEPRRFSPSNYAAACTTCHGLGTRQVPCPDKLIVRPERPLCDGAMYSPGFFPKGYLCKPYNGGYDMVQALAARYGFDPAQTPWNEMTPGAQQAFLYGDPEPLLVTFTSRTGRVRSGRHVFPGFYGWVRDWDVGGTYTETRVCPDCQGARLRPEYAAVQLGGYAMQQLSQMPLAQLKHVLEDLRLRQPEPGTLPTQDNAAEASDAWFVDESRGISLRRLHFLCQVGLGYLHLDRPAASLSAGEAQRIKLAGLLGSQLTSLTVLLDEPTRGLHPGEVSALLATLQALRDEGNTVIVVEHDPLVMRAADYLVDLGPGAGAAGGQIVARGTPEQVMQTDTLTARWLRGEKRLPRKAASRQVQGTARGWLIIQGARGNNLHGDEVRFPLGKLVGVCGVSGSGKSTLVIDTLGRALAPRKQTTSVAYEPINPEPYQAIQGAPARAILVDQSRAGLINPADYLGISRQIIARFAEGEDAQALGLEAAQLARKCSTCGGNGVIKMDMGFLPDVYTPCETCRGTGYLPEAWQVRLAGLSLPEVFNLTIDEVRQRFGDEAQLARALSAACEVGLGYLVLRQPGYSLSGGEAQRLKIAGELCRKANGDTLYLLDEPTIGQHLEDVARLAGVLRRLVEAGHTVLVVEHQPHLLAACDWLVELGPGGGPEGGRVIAAGTPERLAEGHTPTAPYLHEVLG